MQLGEQLGGVKQGQSEESDRALKILADHSRGHDLPRRRRRRALQRGPRLRAAPAHAPRRPARALARLRPGLPAQVRRGRDGDDGRSYPELGEQRDAIFKWLEAEEEGFGRTLEQGTKLLEDLIARAKETGEEGIAAEDAFRLHDTFGFPVDLTLELASEAGLGVDEEGFEGLMDEQRTRARSQTRAGRGRRRAAPRGRGARQGGRLRHALHRLRDAPTRRRRSARPRPTRTAACSSSCSSRRSTPRAAGRSPTRATSSARPGTAGRAVEDVLRLGDDQVVAVRPEAGELVARRSRSTRTSTPPRATPPRATTPPPTCSTRRCASAWARTCARPAPTSGPTSCASTSPTATRSREEELRDVEDEVNRRIAESSRVGARDDDARRGQGGRSDGAVRREVRRRRAHGRGRGRVVLPRAVRRHARALDGRDRRLQDHVGDLERGQRAAHRGGHRPGGGRPAARPRPHGRGRRHAPAHAARASARPGRAPRGRAQGAREAAQGRRRRRRLRRGRRARGARPRSSTARAC